MNQPLTEKLTACMEQAVRNNEAAGVSLLIRRKGGDMAFAAAGWANRAAEKPIRRDSIFRLYSQSKPVTAAAVMLLVERGQLDLLDGADKFLPGFRNPRVIDGNGTITPALRAPWIWELLSMTAGLSYPDADPAGQCAARVFEQQQADLAAGKPTGTVEFCDRLGREPLAFQPGTHWRYSTCADVLGAIVEIVSGKPFGRFLQEEFFDPLGMKDTAFWVPPEKRDRLVTAYEHTPDGLKEYEVRHLSVGPANEPPAFESGGAGLFSTLDDYAAFAQMLMDGGEYRGRRILAPATVKAMTQPQLDETVRRDMWDSLCGYNYGHLMRVCDRPGACSIFASPGEYGWDGWLGTYFINLPREGVTFLMFQNTRDAGTCTVTRKCRNLLAAALEE